MIKLAGIVKTGPTTKAAAVSIGPQGIMPNVLWSVRFHPFGNGASLMQKSHQDLGPILIINEGMPTVTSNTA
jgi:hypothetical protein